MLRIVVAVGVLGTGGAADGPNLPLDTLPRPLFAGQVPAGLAELSYPPDNEWDASRTALGRSLFFSAELSVDRSISCASCHDPRHGFSTPDAFPRGVGGQPAARHPPTLFNRAYGRAQHWDGLVDSLEEQVLLPIQNEREMALSLDQAVGRLRAHPELGAAFLAAFGEPANEHNLALALAAFVRHLLLGDSPVDRFREGRIDALTARERAGMWLFESKGGCWRCHQGANFSDESFHNTGVGVREGLAEAGRESVTHAAEDRGRFKTPTLRGAGLRGPFMHDGSLATLTDVVEFYRRGGGHNPQLDAAIRPLDLTDQEVGQLVAFLEALSRAAP